ncbi:MAG TPA: glucokinase [Candidatus Eisenbacteria bacterium]|jgi:glucokinase
MVLAGDVGGTKTILALYPDDAPPRRPAVDLMRPSRDYPSLEALIAEIVATAGVRPRRAVIGVAGPVVNNRCEATNLPWVVSGDAVGAALGGAEVLLVNDLEATARGLDELTAADLETLQRGERTAGNRALIAAGTGLGESILVWDGERHRPTPSEGGHGDFAPANPLQDELLAWLRARFGHVSLERVLSGPGLADLYRFLEATGRGSEPRDWAQRFERAEDAAALVTAAALDGSSERARLALETFVEVYGAAAGNLALTALAVGGVFVGGGIAPRMIAALRDGRFVRAFCAKGRLAPLLERIPLAVVLDPRTALWGAAALALRSGALARAVP